MKVRKVIIICGLLTIVAGLMGCDAFVRKFTRKPKQKDLTPQELVLVPQEYLSAQISADELYRQTFLFWKSWQDELISSLSLDANHKKQIECVGEALKNLRELKALLSEDKQKKLDVSIEQMLALEGSITQDLYGNSISRNLMSAERIRRNILRDFSYNKIKPLQ